MRRTFPRNTMKPILYLAVIASISGCATMNQQRWVEPSQSRDQTVESFDHFTKLVSHRGPDIAMLPSNSLYLRSWKSADGGSTYQIYVRHSYHGKWRFYEAAYDIQGRSLEFTKIDRQVGYCGGYSGCNLIETFGIGVDLAYLKSASTSPTGITFKSIGQSGEIVLNIPASYVAGFLERQSRPASEQRIEGYTSQGIPVERRVLPPP